MPDRVRDLGSRLVEWWKHFTRKQQMIIASSTLVVIIAIAILAVVLTKPEMVIIKQCETATEAATVQSLLDENGIYNEVSDNGMVFTIRKKDSAKAHILLGSNAIKTEDEKLQNILNGSLSTTESDKAKLYKEYQEKNLASYLESLSNVESAIVSLDIPNDDGTLVASKREASAAVFLTPNGEISEEQAMGLAQMVATELGNETTEHISIMDNNMNLLYAGGIENSSTTGLTSSQLSFKQKWESNVKENVRDVLLGTGQYQSVEVGLNMPLDFNESKTTSKKYSVPDGQAQGYLKNESAYDEETTSTPGGVPGTDGNGEDGNTYVLNDGENTTQTISDRTNNYALDEEIREDISKFGGALTDQASISVATIAYVKYDEDALRAAGELEDMTFDEYRAQIESQGSQQQEVGEDIISAVSMATGIAADRISIIAYQEPVFIPTEGSGRTLADYLEILLAVLLFALLGFVVFMSTRKDKAPEIEPELSVETLLQATKENEEENLEDIGFKEKSEARVLIEKFVEEKPEAVASLLRNWLNEDWE
ncbi:MAG: flagellar biosynthesis protein [Eubacterium sp.]|nr:flagellar biosynthesis protein [Eubacterium sp.]